MAAISQWWAAAQGAWPGVVHDPAVFFEWLGQLSEHDLARAKPLDLSDLFLARAALAGDRAALRLLDSVVLARARTILRGVGDDDFISEVVQVTREQLLMARGAAAPKLDGYQGSGSLVNWVRAILYRRAMTMRRLSRDRGTPEPLALLPASTWSADLQFIKAVHRRAFAQAFAEAFSELDERARGLLRGSLVDELSIDVLSERFGTHRATVARWIAAAKLRLSQGVEQRLKAKLELGGFEYDAILGSLEDNLQVSLGRLIRQGSAA